MLNLEFALMPIVGDFQFPGIEGIQNTAFPVSHFIKIHSYFLYTKTCSELTL